ncbi:hypothetical protein Gotur_015036 [Gossypium turneri]
MEKGFLDKVEDNTVVRIWFEKRQQEKETWDQWDDEIKQLFYREYGDLPYLLDVKVDKYLFRALTQYWNPAYSYFTFEKVDLMPTVEEDFDWVPLLRIWGVVGYASLLVLSWYRLRQFILSSELGKRIKKLEKEKVQLGLDIDVQKLEAEKMKKGKNKAEEDLDSLKIDDKKLCLSIRTVGLGKMSEQWRQAIQEENIRVDHCNYVTEVKASRIKIEELKGKIEELEVALQYCQIRDRDYIMGEALTQVREVADHLETLAIQADMLSLRYELESDRG